MQQIEQKHQQQTRQMEQRHAQQQQKMESRQPVGRPPQSEPPEPKQKPRAKGAGRFPAPFFIDRKLDRYLSFEHFHYFHYLLSGRSRRRLMSEGTMIGRSVHPNGWRKKPCRPCRQKRVNTDLPSGFWQFS